MHNVSGKTDFQDYAELVWALRQQYQVGGQEAKAFLAHSRPTQATLNASGRDRCLARDQTDALCRALEVQLEPIEMEYYSVCTLIRSDEQDRYESALEASPELILQSALWELQSCCNTAGYLAAVGGGLVEGRGGVALA